MKLRIKGNSIRFRLTKSEVDYFEKFRSIEEKTEFGHSTLTYAVKQSSGNDLAASMENNCITLHLPETMANEWVQTQRVGFNAEMEIGGGKKLYLLIEKDFKCLDETSEDQSDNYENPLAHK